MIALVLILVRHERDRSPGHVCVTRCPKTGRVGGKVWLWVLPFVLSAAVNALPIDPIGPLPETSEAIGTDRMDHYFNGNWLGYGLVVAVALLAPVAEELLFRGLLLPRGRRVFGRGDVVANGVLFTLYHVHQPWSMPETLIDGIIDRAYPARRCPEHVDGTRRPHGAQLCNRRGADRLRRGVARATPTRVLTSKEKDMTQVDLNRQPSGQHSPTTRRRCCAAPMPSHGSGESVSGRG